MHGTDILGLNNIIFIYFKFFLYFLSLPKSNFMMDIWIIFTSFIGGET